MFSWRRNAQVTFGENLQLKKSVFYIVNQESATCFAFMFILLKSKLKKENLKLNNFNAFFVFLFQFVKIFWYFQNLSIYIYFQVNQ